MRLSILFFFLYVIRVFGIESDFDYVVVGTSPISMFEAIYKRSLGNRVLVVEQDSVCGGAWKSIDICGIEHVDLGCHEFGNDLQIREFLEEYAGCQLNSDMQSLTVGKNHPNFYPSNGCYELTSHLQLLMEVLGVQFMLNSKLEHITLDKDLKIADVLINGRRYTTGKIVVSTSSEIQLTNHASFSTNRRKYFHLYLLISDPTATHFTYLMSGIAGVSRMINLTHFAHLETSGKQLIAIQVQNEQSIPNAQKYFEELKNLNLIDKNATLLCSQSNIYEQALMNHREMMRLEPNANAFFEILDTSHINNLRQYLDKWKKVMKRWNEIMHPESH